MKTWDVWIARGLTYCNSILRSHFHTHKQQTCTANQLLWLHVVFGAVETCIRSGLYTYYDYHEAMVLEVDMLLSYTTVKWTINFTSDN